MATYTVKEDEKFPWVKVITIESDYPIDISTEYFNITVKDQLDFFIKDYIKDGNKFELEELLKKDTDPTIEICNFAKQYVNIDCFNCGGEGKVICSSCNGVGILYPMVGPAQGCYACGGRGLVGEPDFIQGTGKILCPSCSGDGLQRTVCEDEYMYTEQLVSTVQQYLGATDKHLIENGIQFWIDGSNNKKMYIRIVTKGRSSINPSGYPYWDEDTQDYQYTEYVGFTVADFNITLNENERLHFNVFMVPTIRSGDPQKVEPDAEEPVQKLPDGEIRTDFIWDEIGNQGLNNLYVNNAYPDELISAYSYQQASAIPNKWFVEGPENLEGRPTPLYELRSSAYLNDYLVVGTTKDLLTREFSSRNFVINSGDFNSYLYDEYTKRQIELPYEMSDVNIEDTIYLSASHDYVSGTLYCNEIIQTIINSADDTAKIRKNQVKLELEI